MLSERQIIATLVAGGAQDLEMPEIDEVRAAFDAALIAEPVPESSRAALLRKLGVR